MTKPLAKHKSSSVLCRAKLYRAQDSTSVILNLVFQPYAPILLRISALIYKVKTLPYEYGRNRLQNNVVSKKGAQAASCLKLSDFNKALNAVEAAIGKTRRQPDTGSSTTDADQLDLLTPRKSPSKRTRRSSPSKSPEKLVEDISPTRNPVVSSSSRANFDDILHKRLEKLGLETPTRKRVAYATGIRSTPFKVPETDPMDVDNEPLPLQEPIPRSSRKGKSVGYQGIDDKFGSDDEHIAPVRFRPVFLDHKQWYEVDKRVKQLWDDAKRETEDPLVM